MKAAIIGLGRIAWKYDFGSRSNFSRTHFSALNRLSGCEIFGVDSSPAARDEFTEKTKRPSFSSLEELHNSIGKIDLVSICSPNSYHFEHCLSAFKLKVPWVWLEKPAGSSENEIEKMLLESRAYSGTRVLVNYPRRFSEPYLKLADTISSKRLGEIIEIRLCYSRDLRINGCHLIDLAIWYLKGETFSLQYSDNKKPNPTSVFLAKNKRIVIAGYDVDFHNIDIEITFTRGRAAVLYGGKVLKIENRVKNQEFEGFTRLEQAQQEDFEHTANTFGEALNGLLSSDLSHGSTLEDALLIEKVMSQMENGN